MMMKATGLKRVISVIAAMMIVLTGGAISASAEVIPLKSTLDIGDGDIVFGNSTISQNGHQYAYSVVQYTITGSSTTNSITFTGGTHNILFKNLSITRSDFNGYAVYFKPSTTDIGGIVTPAATVNLTLEGTNTVTSGYGYSGVCVSSGASLTISGDGTLNATGGEYGAGIGSNSCDRAGSITINSGTINAVGGDYSAGIGGGGTGSGGTLTINGGTVNATAGSQAAAIGGGSAGNFQGITYGYSGNIVINGGTVIATSNCYKEAGIGASSNGYLESISINGGTVTATAPGTGIGGQGGNVSISSGNITARGDMTGIKCSTINISGGTVTANGGTFDGIAVSYGTACISGGTVTATGGTTGAGIGGADCQIYIKGGIVNATGDTECAGIGGCAFSNESLVDISGGTVTARGGDCGAGIGGGEHNNHFSVNISDGTVYAYGGALAAGIGGGDSNGSGEVKISGGTITAVGDDDDDWCDNIGSGFDYNDPVNVSITGGNINGRNIKLAAVKTSVFYNLWNVDLPKNVTSASLASSVLSATDSPYIQAKQLINSNGSLGTFDNLCIYKTQLIDQDANTINNFDGTITLKIRIPNGMSGDMHVFYYDGSTGKLIDMNAAIEDNCLAFKTANTGYFVITQLSAPLPAKTEPVSSNPKTADADKLYIITAAVLLCELSLAVLTRFRRRV